MTANIFNKSVKAQKAIDALNGLLRGEMSAIETYRQAISKSDGELGVTDLNRINVEHFEAAGILRESIYQLAGSPVESSEAWGAFVRAVEGAATILGDKTALRALREGEKIGASSYEQAMTNPDLPAECIRVIRMKLLPQTQKHVLMLDQLIAAR